MDNDIVGTARIYFDNGKFVVLNDITYQDYSIFTKIKNDSFEWVDKENNCVSINTALVTWAVFNPGD